MFNHQFYLTKFIADFKTCRFVNDSQAKIDRSPAVAAYRIIGVHKLTGFENSGKHNLFIDVLDKDGQRIQKLVDWGWEGQRQGEESRPLVLDKPPSEPSGNIVIWAGQRIWARIMNQPTDVIHGVHTGLPDEGNGNTWGHFSYYCVWMWDEGTPDPVDPPPAEDCADLIEENAKLRLIITSARDMLDRV